MEVIYSLFYVWIFSRNPTTWSTDGNLLIHEKNHRKELDSVNLKEREFERTKFFEWEHVLSFRKFFENSQNDEIWLLWSSFPRPSCHCYVQLPFVERQECSKFQLHTLYWYVFFLCSCLKNLKQRKKGECFWGNTLCLSKGLSIHMTCSLNSKKEKVKCGDHCASCPV